MAPDTSVRTATPADAGIVARLLHDFNAEFDTPTPPVGFLSHRLEGLLAGDEMVVLLGGEGPDGVAVLRFRPSIWSEGLECYLAELYVVPARRRQGLGRALMTSALEIARERGAEEMEIGVDEPDVPARRLYESLGFTRQTGSDLMFVYEREL